MLAVSLHPSRLLKEFELMENSLYANSNGGGPNLTDIISLNPGTIVKTVRVCYVATPENSKQSSIAPTTSYDIFSNVSIAITSKYFAVAGVIEDC